MIVMIDECEQELVEQSRSDPQAFRALYNRYLPRLYAYMSYRVGRKQDAEDLVAETFLKVVEDLKRFEWRHDNSFGGWLFRIAHNLSLNFQRDTWRAGESLPLDALPSIAAHALLPQDEVLRKEIFARLHRLVNELPPRRREVITLKYFTGLHNKEIADMLGLDERTVSSNLSRALGDMQKKYSGQSDWR
jgi:RNA polymerase sigma-70 factor (ECF subfamily)